MRRKRKQTQTEPMPAVELACPRCRVSGPLFALSGGNDGALSAGIMSRGNHFHLIGLWMELTNTGL